MAATGEDHVLDSTEYPVIATATKVSAAGGDGVVGAAPHAVNLDVVLEVAISAAKAGGEVVLAGFSRKGEFDIFSKGGVDMVTSVDKASEARVLGVIRAAFPDHAIVAEESLSDTAWTDKPTWFVDPLDGTTNFVHGYPFVCIAIGFAVNRELSVGVVYNPILNQMYKARIHKGAYLNDQRIHVSGATELNQALVCCNIGASRDPAFIDLSLKCMRNAFLSNVHSIRMTGSAAVNMCHVAQGVLDAYWELKVGGPWDLAAGAVIVREAGGVVTSPTGGPFDLIESSLLCGPASIVTKLGGEIAAAHSDSHK